MNIYAIVLFLIFTQYSNIKANDLLSECIHKPFGITTRELERFIADMNLKYPEDDSSKNRADTNYANSSYFYDYKVAKLISPTDTIESVIFSFYNDMLYKISYNPLQYSPVDNTGNIKLKKNIKNMNNQFGKATKSKIKNKDYGWEASGKVSFWKGQDKSIKIIEYDYPMNNQYVISDNKLQSEVALFTDNLPKLSIDIEHDIFKDVNSKKERERMGEGGVFEKFVGKEVKPLDNGFNYERSRIKQAQLLGDYDSISLVLIDVTDNTVLTTLENLSSSRRLILTDLLKDSISEHLNWKNKKCKTWHEEYFCSLEVRIYIKGKLLYTKPFQIWPLIG